MNKIRQTDFFKKKPDSESVKNSGESVGVQRPHDNLDGDIPAPVRVIQISKDLTEKVKKAGTILREIDMRALANEVAYLYSKVVDEKFTVAIVGEFSKGKSTLINRLFGKDFLPISTLPTTAVLTRITYGKVNRMIVYNKTGQRQRELPLNQNSWDGLTAANFAENEPEGFVDVELNNTFLGKYGIDILDTPGAGDLEEKRAKVIERCLVGADGAVIVISATKLLSMTEQAFIRQKVMSRGIPFMAIALTHLDLIPIEERERVVTFLFKKLEKIKLKIPVFIADDNVEIPGGKYSELIGFRCLRGLILSWMSHEHRRELTEKWLTTNILSVLEVASTTLAQQEAILRAKGEEREQLIANRNKALSKVKVQWQALRDELHQRCEKCIALFNAKAMECGEMITETLQHEVARQPNPKEWLDNEYSYRVKRELSAVSLTLDNLVANQIAADLRWLNDAMAKQFKEIVNYNLESLKSKETIRADVNENELKLDSLKSQSTKATVVSSALTLGAALLLGVSGAAPLILATMGVGTGANLISRRILEKKGDAQREEIKALIAQEMPRIISEASSDSSIRIKILYSNIISESLATETRWMQTQRNLIRQSVNAGSEDMDKKVAEAIARVNQVKKEFE